MILLACSILLIGTLLYVFAPAAGFAGSGLNKSRLQYLYERREAIYENLRDLNFEFNAGKYPAADYESISHALENEAAAVVSEIKALESHS